MLASAIEELRVIGEYIFSASENDSEEGPADGGGGGGRFESAVNNSLDLTQPTNDALLSLGLPRIITLKGKHPASPSMSISKFPSFHRTAH
ncbi:unnamed protein product [Dibothriocephalus latus]|uniref:Uncharacterized protein n=1 Tax=Dibothriocephalus latus TaxID=60516 RepID=A0A3P6QQN3_DIBLA|nr:unnamed protein product [Dibothriocephalus latus]